MTAKEQISYMIQSLQLAKNEIEYSDTCDDVYFKYHCLYNAETELYDRTLTDERDRYDQTSAFIDGDSMVRKLFTQNAIRLYRWCKERIEKETGLRFNRRTWVYSVIGYENLSAQGWIDLYSHLVEIRKYKGCEE